MKKQRNYILELNDLKCADACLVNAIVKIVIKNLSEIISSDPDNNLVLGSDNKLKA